MTDSKFGELTLEQKFNLEALRVKSSTLPTDILKDTIVQEYIKMIYLDVFYKRIIKEKWGLENGSK
ncbi:MAG: hypothetical protein LW728_21785 [Microcystis sp. 49638_E5]|jgi:hypothetical protein|uniref:hypothetical protein n=1 Tax=Microcystis sp. 49638_E5 TaxID=2904986 RepID=UPI002585F54B|nr:hypothetical protein [Microcystis sp. 49638_E5]MCE2671772.1 hypothetical protein [Microcystis sp. 49638_E5]